MRKVGCQFASLWMVNPLYLGEFTNTFKEAARIDSRTISKTRKSLVIHSN
jgi:hypothetical protein